MHCLLRNIVMKVMKGIVHPKYNLLTLKLFQTPMNFCLLLNPKEDILKKIWVTKQLMVPTDFHSIEEKKKSVGTSKQILQKYLLYVNIWLLCCFIFTSALGVGKKKTIQY